MDLLRPEVGENAELSLPLGASDPAGWSISSYSPKVNNCCSFFRSSIGKKWVVAVTGGILLLYVIAHLIGNLQVFAGPGDATHPAKINAYAQMLKSLGVLLWVARIGLLIAVIAHIVATIKLTIENRKAKGGGQQYKKTVQARISTRTMIWSGTYILCFVIFHLAHYTLLVVEPGWKQLHDAHGLHDVYAMLLLGFSSPVISAFYIVGMILLCMHLSHGIESSAQTLGVQTQKVRGMFRIAGRTLAVLLAIGYISIPVAVLAGFGKEYREQAAAKIASAKGGN
jgi:succinate dehydrogenase / fumarate reductase cytochrome b subunit